MGERQRNAPDQAPAPAGPRRGVPMTAKQVVREFFTDADGNELVSDKWVRDTVPGKYRLSHSRAIWYSGEVAEWIATRKVDRR